jgi:hypothetical protein
MTMGACLSPFGARQEFIDRRSKHGVSGFETCPGEVARVASRGRRKPTGGHEPEERILKRRNVLDAIRHELPVLRGVAVTGRLDVRLLSVETEDNRKRPANPS